MDKTHWFRCPGCGQNIIKLTDKSLVVNELYCRRCKTAYDVRIEGLRVLECEEVKKAG